MTDHQDLATYLRLAPEFGGTQFGPFEGLEVRLGSDAERCHIVLPENLGVLGEHARLIRQGVDNLILTPAERTATVFLWKEGARRPTQLNTPTAVQVGDAFSLVTPNGPRFIIELDLLPPEIVEERKKSRKMTGRNRLSAESMGDEVKRQAFTKILVMGPMQLVQRALVFVRSGAIYQPRNVIMMAAVAGGWLFGGAMMCSSGRNQAKVASVSDKYQNCQQELAFVDGLSGDSTEYNFGELAATIVGSNRLGTGLEQDKNLQAKVKEKATSMLSGTQDYRWLVRAKSKQASEFAQWRERIEESELDLHTQKLAIWLGAKRGKSVGDFIDLEDSEGNDVCGRGPLAMTYRQGLHLGLSVAPDALYLGRSTSIDGEETRAELLSENLALSQEELPEDSFVTKLEPVRQSRGYCIHIDQDDDRERTRIRAVIRAMEKELGTDAPGVPTDSGHHSYSTSRIAKYWASDLTLVDYRDKRNPGIEFPNDSVPSAVLDRFDSRGAWVLDRTALTIAQAVVAPCLAVLNGDASRVEGVLGETNLPSSLHCLVLNWKLSHEE